MDEQINTQQGGFIPPQAYPSPTPSHASTSSTMSNLPHPRANPLRAGSAKEDAARRYVEARLLNVSRRYAKKFQTRESREEGEVAGYNGFGEVAKDLGEVVDVVWLSGTPSLQIPYLMNVALTVQSYLPVFPSSPKATFTLLRKLDHAFSSLLKGEDSTTGEILPGFAGGMRAGMSKTDMVRCKGIVDSTRVLVVDVMGRGIGAEESEVDMDAETDTEGRMDVDDDEDEDGEEGALDMQVARVYEGTIETLGQTLGGDLEFQP